MDHNDHYRRQHRALIRPSSSLSNSTPPVLSFEQYLEEFKDPITPFDIEISWNGNWNVAACPGPTGRRCSNCNGFRHHLDQIIVGVDGACRNNGLSNAEASIGVFFGYESRYNLSERIIRGPFTNQRAELIATYRALEEIKSFQSYESVDIEDDHPINSVIIKSDSAYVVNGLTQWVWTWETNGYQTARGTPVVNADLFRLLVRKIYALKDVGMEIYFWKVDRDYNGDADLLANKALDSQD